LWPPFSKGAANVILIYLRQVKNTVRGVVLPLSRDLSAFCSNPLSNKLPHCFKNERHDWNVQPEGIRRNLDNLHLVNYFPYRPENSSGAFIAASAMLLSIFE
jgi:hypothetical protein